jgi:hypothetical protein
MIDSSACRAGDLARYLFFIGYTHRLGSHGKAPKTLP